MMSKDVIDKNELIEYLIKNSIFTKRQITIIYNRRGKQRVEGVSRGTYYRMLQQSRNNIKKVLTSLILLEILGLLDNEKKNALDRLMRQLHGLLNSDIDVSDVIYIIDEVMKRLSKV